MAQKIVTTLVDDLDGTEIENGNGTTVSFALDGKNYEIDLTEENAAKFRNLFTEYIEAGRSVGSNSRRARSGGSSAPRKPGSEASAAREWLRAQGHEVPSRGRIPGELMAIYSANH